MKVKSTTLGLWDRLLYVCLKILPFPWIIAWLSVCFSLWWVVLCCVVMSHTVYPFSWCTLILLPGFRPCEWYVTNICVTSFCVGQAFLPSLGMYRSGIAGSYMSLLFLNLLRNCQFSKVSVFFIPISTVCQNLILSVFSIWDIQVSIYLVVSLW